MDNRISFHRTNLRLFVNSSLECLWKKFKKNMQRIGTLWKFIKCWRLFLKGLWSEFIFQNWMNEEKNELLSHHKYIPKTCLIKALTKLYTSSQVNSINFTHLPIRPLLIHNNKNIFSSLHLYTFFLYVWNDFWQALISFVSQDNIPWRTHNHESNHST